MHISIYIYPECIYLGFRCYYIHSAAFTATTIALLNFLPCLSHPLLLSYFFYPAKEKTFLSYLFWKASDKYIDKSEKKMGFCCSSFILNNCSAHTSTYLVTNFFVLLWVVVYSYAAYGYTRKHLKLLIIINCMSAIHGIILNSVCCVADLVGMVHYCGAATELFLKWKLYIFVCNKHMFSSSLIFYWLLEKKRQIL